MVLLKFIPAKDSTAHIIFWILALIHLFIPLYNHFLFRSHTYDYAVYNFAFYDFAHFRNSPCTVYHFPAPVTFFQDHFSFLLPLISPLYWLTAPVTGTYSLIIIQWVLVVAGAASTFRIISRRTDSDLLPLLSVVMYFMLHGRFAAHRQDVNLAIIASALLPVFIDYFDRRRTAPMIVLFVILLITREDVSLWLVFVGLFQAVYYRRDRPLRNRALIISFFSLLYFVLCLKVFIPGLIETDYKKFDHFEYGALGDSPGEALRYLFHDPVRVVELLFINHSGNSYFDHIKTDFYVVYLLSGGILLLLRPIYLIPLLPLLAKKMLNDNPVRWGMDSYYSIEFVGILPVLVFLLLAGLKNTRISSVLALTVGFATVVCTLVRFSIQPVSRLQEGEDKFNILSPSFYRPTLNGDEVRHVMRLVPAGAPVSATKRIVPHLAYRDSVYYFPRRTNNSFLLLLKQNDSYPLSEEMFAAEVKQLVEDTSSWNLMYESEMLLLLKGNSQSQ